MSSGGPSSESCAILKTMQIFSYFSEEQIFGKTNQTFLLSIETSGSQLVTFLTKGLNKRSTKNEFFVGQEKVCKGNF